VTRQRAERADFDPNFARQPASPTRSWAARPPGATFEPAGPRPHMRSRPPHKYNKVSSTGNGLCAATRRPIAA